MTQYLQQPVTLSPVNKKDVPILKQEIKDAFLKGLQDSFSGHKNPAIMGPIPSDEDFQHSFTDKASVVRQLMLNGERIGGVVLHIDIETQRSEVHFLYINANFHGKGLGTKAWEAIELAFPETKIWELHTPYFEKRNIHFYVNKCGFNIVEFYHKGHPGPNVEGEKPESDAEYEFFRFEKVMI